MPEIRYEAKMKDSGVVAGFKQIKDAEEATATAGKKVESAFELQEKAASKATTAFEGMKGALVAVGAVFAASKIIGFLGDAVDASQKLQTAMLGLGSVAGNLGADIGKAKKAAQDLTKDGFLNLADSSKALQNLLASGLNIDFATELLNKNKDAAIFNRQSHLGLSESIRVFTDGFKNEISTLTDATGVSTNYARALDDTFKAVKAGVLDLGKYNDKLSESEIATVKHAVAQTNAADKLDKTSKSILAGVGFLKELELFQGNAAKGADLLAVKQQQLDSALLNVKAALGDAMLPALSSVIGSLSEFVGSSEKSITGAKALADAFALPVKVFYAFAAGIDDLVGKFSEFHAKALAVNLSLAKVADALGITKGAAEKVQAEIDSWNVSAAAAHKAADFWRQKLTDLDVALDNFGRSTTPEATKKARELADAHSAAAAETEKERKELEKLGKAFDDALNPTVKLNAEMLKLQGLGKSQADITTIYRDKLVKATAAAFDHGQAVSDTALKYGELAVAQRRATEAAESFKKSQDDLKAPLIDVKTLFEGYELAIDETGKAYWRLKDAIDAVPLNRSLNDLIIKPAQINENRRFLEDAGVLLKKTPREVRDVWSREISTITNDWVKGIADILVEGGDFKDKMTGIAKDTGKAMLRAFLDDLLSPLKNAFLEFGRWLSGKFKGLIGLGTGGTAGPGGLGGLGTGTSGRFGAGGIVGTGAAGGLLGFGLGGSSASGRILGVTAGTIGGLALGGGIAGAAGGIGFGAGSLGTLAGLFTNPWTAAAVAAALGVAGILKWARGKNAYEAGSLELGRDFGGLSYGKNDFKSWLQSMGISESQAYPIRKDLLSSPKFLTEVSGPLAKAQGRMDAFLASLERVETAWGTFDFRKAYELGDATGDWTELDKAFTDAFSSSKALADNIPDWKDKLLAGGAAAVEVTSELQPLIDGFTSLRDAFAALDPVASDIYQTFFETGEILPEFRRQIEEYGGDLAAFEDVARLAQLDAEFADLTDTFRETGEVTERLRDIFREFGGDLEVLDRAAEAKDLKATLDSIADFRTELDKISPDKTGLEKVLEGIYDEAALVEQGLDPTKFRAIADLINARDDWDKAVADFDRTGKLVKGGVLEQGLLDYGGEKGKLAIDRYGQGYNTITKGLLADTKTAMDRDLSAEKKKLLAYLDDIEASTKSKRDKIVDDIEDQFALVGRKIADTFEDARKLAIVEIDRIIDRLNEAVTLAATLPAAEAYLPPPPADPTSTSMEVNITFTGDINGVEDLEESVARAWTRVADRGGFRGYITRRTPG